MRSGLIARKVGMTRVFDADGSHVPVSRARRRQVEPLMLPRLGR